MHSGKIQMILSRHAGLHGLNDVFASPCRTILLCLWMALLVLGCSREESPMQTTASVSVPDNYEGTIVAMGDSLTEGFGVAEEQTYPFLLQERLKAAGYNYKVVNAGISGETSSGARSRLNWVLTIEPDIVILETGGNDGLRGLDPQLLKDNIDYMVKELLDHDIRVVLAGMKMVSNLGLKYTRSFADVYPQIARENDIILIPFFLEGVAGRSGLNQADGIHPTAEGYAIVVEHILPYIIEAIKIDMNLSPKGTKS